MNSGFLVINKPKGETSFSIVSKLRKITGVRKIGFAGTLDPLATGVLIFAVGREATRKLQDFSDSNKAYRTILQLGVTSDTYDIEGKITENDSRFKIQDLGADNIREALGKFVGDIRQTAPPYSARKISGQRAYEKARAGEDFNPGATDVTINAINIVSYQWPFLELEIDCSTGTYIRSIANDLGDALGIGAIVTELTRTRVGEVSIDDSIDLKSIDNSNWEKYLI